MCIRDRTCSFKNSEPSFQVFADRQRAQSIMPPSSISDSHGTWQVINIVLWIKHCLLYIHVHVLTKEIRVVYESLANVNKRIRRINELVTSEGFVDSAHIPHTDWLKPNLFIKQWPCWPVKWLFCYTKAIRTIQEHLDI